MCSASVGSEGSVTLQLRDVNSTDSNQSTGLTTLDNALTIGYPDPEMLADVLGTLQTACNSLKTDSNSSSNSNDENGINGIANNNNNCIIINNNNNNNSSSSGITITNKKLILQEVKQQLPETVNTSTNTVNRTGSIRACGTNNKSSCSSSSSSTINSISISSSSRSSISNNCLISCNNGNSIQVTNVQVMSSSNSAATTILNRSNSISNSISSNINSHNNQSTNNCHVTSSSNHNNSNTHYVNGNNNLSCSTSGSESKLIVSSCNNKSNSNKNPSINCVKSISCGSSSSSNSNGSSSSNCSSSNNIIINNNINKHVSGIHPPNLLKKSRPKLSSPTRHGPQQCQVCNKVFGNASALAKHKLTHSDERKYVCAMCSKAFKRQDHLNGHMMTHRNKKPYECKADGCGKSYCDARSLRRHTENHHAVASVVATAAATTASTPEQQNLSINNSNSLGLSLSPATASGDASSPDGATCIRTYITTAGNVVDAQIGALLSDEQLKSINISGGITVLSPSSSNSSSSVSAPSPITIADATLESDGLTRQQLDLISHIMQQTKQSSAQVTVSTSTNINSYKIDTATATTTTSTATVHSTTVQQLQRANSMPSRPRTWNMQTHMSNSNQKVAITLDNNTNAITTATTTTASTDDGVELNELNQQLVDSINPHLLNIVKIDQKPVECNLCHRKFKNIPALNGHMRLHGGYFKKDPETKKTEKKDTSGPPLQTASIGVRALIEEKIISKRRKDLNKGAFAVPAPPSSVAPNVIKRSPSESLEYFLTPKTHTSAAGGNNAAGQQLTLPAVTTIRNSSLSIHPLGLPQSVEIVNTKEDRAIGNVSVGMGATNNAAIPPSPGNATVHTTTTKSTSTDPKDSTLIELLKRGTRVAIANKRTQHSTNNNLDGTSDASALSQQLVNTNNQAMIVPSELQVLPNHPSKNHSHDRLNRISDPVVPIDISLSEATPLSLTISQTTGSSGDIYTLTYSTDSSGIFGEAEVYDVSDADMLLQTVDSIQLINDATDPNQLREHSDQFRSASLAASTSVDESDGNSVASLTNSMIDCPTTYHSKELLVLNNSDNVENIKRNHQSALLRTNSLNLPIETLAKQQVLAASSMVSPLHSPLAYPTPPASHENVTQSSPFVDEAQNFVDTANAFFNEKRGHEENVFFKDMPGSSVNQFIDDAKILKLNKVLEDGDFDTVIKVEDLLSGSDDTECDLREFTEQNLSFLDDEREFLNGSVNAASPLSESFFTSGMGTAEEVKEVLREVLPEEHTGEAQSSHVIDLYYLPGIGLQSHMMPNSEDPLLSSSPKDFGHNQRGGQHHILQVHQFQIQHHQQQQQQLYETQLQQQHIPQRKQSDSKSQEKTIQATLEPLQQSSHDKTTNDFPQLMERSATSAAIASPEATTPQLTHNENQQFNSISKGVYHYKHSDGIDSAIIYTGSTDREEIAINVHQANLDIAGEIANQSLDEASLYFNNNSNGNLTLSHTNAVLNRVPAAISVSSAPVVPLKGFNRSEPLSLPVQTGSILKRRLRSNDSIEPPKYRGLYRSKLRKPTPTHYTPAPALNPDRKGVGLYCNVRQSFTAATITFDSVDDDFDDPVGLVDFSDDSKVNLGSAYQAQIPLFEPLPPPTNNDESQSSRKAYDELLWDPNIVSCSDSLKRFIELSKSGGPLGYHSEEEALQAVLQARGNLQTAIVMLMNSQSNAFQMKWTARELELFLQGLEKHGKNFSAISQEINTKSIGECVQMYYFWKKLSIDYKLTHLKTEKSAPPNLQPTELKPHVCEMPDCSASFTSKAALHGHTRIHCYGRNFNTASTSSSSPSSSTSSNAAATSVSSSAQLNGNVQAIGQPNSKDDFPCKVCGNEESQVDVIERYFRRNDRAE